MLCNPRLLRSHEMFPSSYSVVDVLQDVFIGFTVASTGAGLFFLVPIYYMNQSASFTSNSVSIEKGKYNVPCGRISQLRMKATPKVAAKHTNTVCVNFPTV